MKILFCGPSGSGKSTIANAVSLQINVPFLKAKDITTKILKRDNYDYASGVQVEKFLSTKARQLEILTQTVLQQNADEFITDRGFIDLASYAMCAIDMLDAETLDKILCTCQTHVKRYSHVFLFQQGELIDNQKRTLNRHYQNLIYTVELGLMKEWKIDYTLIEDCGMDSQFKIQKVIESL